MLVRIDAYGVAAVASAAGIPEQYARAVGLYPVYHQGYLPRRQQ